MKTIFEQYLQENSAFESIALYQKMIKQCSTKCQQSIRNGKNYQSQVSVCTSMCRIRYLRNMLDALQKMYGTNVSDQVLKNKIMYVRTRLAKETQKVMKYRTTLKKRQTKTPVDMSMRPSPERPESDKYDRD